MSRGGSALAGVVEPDHVFGTELEYDDRTGEVRSIRRVPAGYGKVAVVEELEAKLGPRRIAPSTSATAVPTCT